MLCLIVTLPLYSQKASSDTCCVPCNTLKKALIVRQERIYCGTQLGFARDSISTYKDIISSKDTIIQHRDSSINILIGNQARYSEIILNKDSIITTYGNEIGKLRTARNVAYLGVMLSVLLTIFVGL